ncbi:MAG: elongation factor P-like protein YeiP [Candidatus Omnitrophica bacterium]|nr:elongation factor P-like protein YeiP [Candidatus Omnitrophota bacterium]
MDVSECKRGLLVEIESAPCLIEQVTVQTPSARGASTLYKMRIKNLKTGQRLDKTFRSGDSLPEPNFEKRPVQYLYQDGNNFYFMDMKDYSQFSLPLEKIEEQSGYLYDALEGILSLVYNEQVIAIEIPSSVDMQVEDCPPSGTSKSATPRPKEARLKTGKTVLVPDYIEAGETVRIDTRSGEFISRSGRSTR